MALNLAPPSPAMAALIAALPRMEARPVPVPLAGRWRFTADRLDWPTYTALSNPSAVTQLGPVQVTALSFSQSLSEFGAGDVTILVDGGLTRDDLLRLYGWRLWAWHDNYPVWCGWPTGIQDEGGAAVVLSLREVSGFLHDRQFADTYRADQVEQVDIARRLAAKVQEAGVEIVTQAGPGFLRDRSYAYLEGQDRAELLQNLAGVIQGPQFRTEYDIAPSGLPRATLRIAYPRVGSDTGAGVTVPGTAIGYRVAWDTDQLRTMTFAVGDLPEDAPENAVKPVVQLWRPQAGTGRPPRIDRADDYPGTILRSTLAERAEAQATANADPAMDLEFTVSVDMPLLSSYNVGDDITVFLRDPLLEGGLSATGQLLKREINAADGTVNWTIATSQPPPRPRETLTRTLNRYDSQIARAWRSRLVPPAEGAPDT